jgi:hypothetical protein
MVLKYNPHISTHGWYLAPGYPVEVSSVYDYLALTRSFHQDNQLHQSAFTGARMTRKE